MVHFFQLLSTTGLVMLISKLLIYEKFRLILDPLILLAITSAIYFISLIFSIQESSLGFIYLVSLFVYFHISNRKIFINIVSLSASMIIAIFSDILSTTLISFFVNSFSLNAENFRTNIYLYYFSLLIMIIISVSMALLFRKIYVNRANLMRLRRNSELTKVSGFLTIGLFLFLYWLTFSVTNYTTISNSIFLVIVMVIIGAILIAALYFIKSRTSAVELRSKENELEQLMMYTKEIETMHKEIRKFKHDYINILSSLSGYIDANDLNGLKTYFDSKIMTISHNNENIEKTLDRLSFLEQLELKGLFAMKVLRAQEAGIAVVIQIVENIRVSMDIVDLCRIIGIFMDNAIDASQEIEAPKITISIVKKVDRVLIIIANKVENMPPIYKLRENGYTTKGKHRGLGLEIVREILKKNESVTNDLKYENDEFTQILEILSYT
ncbi:sensor histidine kinase [Fusibacter bizertensis]